MEGLRKKKTKYLEKLEEIESKLTALNPNKNTGGMKFFLLYLLYETQEACKYFAEVENQLDEKVFSTDILNFDADIDYKSWIFRITRLTIIVDYRKFTEDSTFENIQSAIWRILDALPPNDSDQYVEFSRTDYKLALQQVLWSKCSNTQLAYALSKLLVQLQKTLCNIGDKLEKLDISLEDGAKLYNSEEIKFNFSEAGRVVNEFKQWKSDCEDDEEIILKRLEGKRFIEIKRFFDSGFLTCKIEQQKEVDFSEYKNEIDLCRLQDIAEGMNVQAYYSAMRELFMFKKGEFIPRKDKIGKFFFKYRKVVSESHRAALFRFIKMLWLIEEEKKPKAKEEKLNYEGIKIYLKKECFPYCEDILCKGYSIEWLNGYIDALMDSEHKDEIAKDWAKSNKQKKTIGKIFATLKECEVIEGTNRSIGNLIDKKKGKTLAKYMGEQEGYSITEWTKKYINKK